ncbi:MAG TPA: hypothetical protein VKZ95_00810 [Sphingobacteriaceae bacterium]|nr:hypothetical protein [Sphingobacteriaceae bacterium]
MPQASDELRQLMKDRFGDEIDEQGPIKYLENSGYSLTKGFLWEHPTNKTYKSMTREEFDCLLFLVHEWDFGGLVGDPKE